GPLTAHVYVGAPLAPGADRRTLAAEAEGVIAAALREMQAGMTKSGAAIAASISSPSASDASNAAPALIEPVDQSGRSA
ncbi:MAG TPA: 1-acyl-sn-glycerol-3-phosphate acyltransferase, partial [Paraburkholderia sp.]|nr:1-acyl-sn-glycerol-3-phosphate acyltransferase [Paraburkholderia sp.]